MFSSKKEWTAKDQTATQGNAARYLVVGLLLLVEAMLLSRL